MPSKTRRQRSLIPHGSPLDHDKLIRVLGMLGSDHPGEVVAAARAAERLRQAAGLTWRDIVVVKPIAMQTPGSIGDALDLCFEHADALTDWERRFCATVARQRSPVSVKQAQILAQIVDKVLRARAAA